MALRKESKMRLPQFEYIAPGTLKEASRALPPDVKDPVFLAGGTDLLVLMKQRLLQPGRVIDLNTLPRLNFISAGKDGIRIGTLTTLHDIASSPLLKERHPALVRSAGEVGAYVHQVMGTLGGNLCQGNRCRYYNQSPFWRSARPPCYKAGGKTCHVVPGRPAGGRNTGICHSAYCGDMAPVLIALDGRAKITGRNGERILPVKKLYTQDGKNPLSLKRGEILKEVLVPPPAGKTLYLKWRLRDSIEFPVISLALNLDRSEDGKIKKARIILSGISPGPVEVSETEKLLKGATLDQPSIGNASRRIVGEISPMRTSTVSPAYKRKMAGVLLKQALEEMAGI
jgi:4-hydroxybenzoyl-CoA reductase subunit beta